MKPGHPKQGFFHQSPGRSRGFSLVEAMLAVLLGSFLVMAAVSVFISSRRTMDTSSALTSVQESSRIAFEMMGRDLREAGGNPCSSSLSYGNVLNARNSTWWSQVAGGLIGYGPSQATPGTPFGAAAGNRLAGTQALDVHTALAGDTAEARITVKMAAGNSDLQISSGAQFAANDIVLVCDPVAAYVVQLSSVSGTTLRHAAGSGTPGNCSGNFTSEFATCATGTNYLFDKNASVAKISSARWYVGPNGRGGNSLFRAAMTNTGTTGTPNIATPTEVAQNVQALNLTYLVTGSTAYVAAASVVDWTQVRAIGYRLDLSAPAGSTLSSKPVERDSTQTIALRNRTL